MESHLSRKYTLAELEPGWPEDLSTARVKSSPRMHGSMMMSLRRVSRSPENSRLYAHGDPVHLIDWKAYARTDELIIREHRDEAAARVGIVLDLSDTLHWPRPDAVRENGMSERIPQKIETAIRVALYLANAHVTMGDMVSIGILDPGGEVTKAWSPRSPADVLGMYQMCLKSGFADAIQSLTMVTSWIPKKFDTTWWLSDFLAREIFPADWSETRKLAVIHVFSWLESSSEWMDGGTSYRDDSRGRKIYLGDQLRVGDQWREAMSTWREKVRKSARGSGGVYMAIDDRTNVGDFFHWLITEAAS